MKNNEYWKKRAESIADLEFKKVDDYTLRLYLEYQEALNSIRKDIEVFYARFAQNNNISLLEARKLLNSNELYKLKMSLEEFRHKAKNNSNFEWEKELNNVSYKVRITRLQALQTQIKNSIEDLYIKQQEGATKLLGDIYKDTYYRNIYEVHKGLGIGINFAKLDNNMVNKVLNEKWQASNYSSRIWNNKEKLIMELQTNLMQAFIRGDSIDKTSKIIANRMEVSKNRARTLVNTESAYITQKATFDSYSNSGVVKEYEILATLDLHTSEICRSLDGKIFKLSEKEIGVTAPPFHPNCRTTTVAYFPGTVDEERIARDSEENIYYVDGNMNYEDWYNKYVKGNSKEAITEKIIQNKYSDKKQFEEYKNVLKDMIPKSFDKFQELKYNNIDEWNEIKNNFKIVNSYKVDFGEVNPKKIIELDELAFSAKRNNQISKYKKQGNFAVLQYNDEIKFASSRIATTLDNEYLKYKGDKEKLILISDEFAFKTAKYGDYVDGEFNEIDRANDTEAKFFEYLNSKISSNYEVNEIFMLSEKKMCESCRNVAKQFIRKHPNIKVNVISGKTLTTWKERK